MLRTERLVLSKLTCDDAAFIVELLTEPSVMKYVGDKGIRSLDDAKAYLREGPISQYSACGYGLYRVGLRDFGISVGLCGLVRREAFPDPDLGFAFLKSYRSNGYALEAASAVLEEAADRFSLRRILAMADEANTASIRLLATLGFRFERMVTMPGESVAIRQYALEAG